MQKLCISAQQCTRQRHRSTTRHEANWAVCEKTGGGHAWAEGDLGGPRVPTCPSCPPVGPGTSLHPAGVGHRAPVLAMGTGRPVPVQPASPRGGFEVMLCERCTLQPTSRGSPTERVGQIHCQPVHVFFNLIFKLQSGINIGFYF